MKRLLLSLFAVYAAVSLYAADVKVKVTYYSPEIVRIEKSAGSFQRTNSVSVIMEPQGTPAKPKVKVSVARDGTVTFTDAKGRKLLTEGASSVEAITDGVDKGFWVVSQEFRLDADEPIYGLGMLQNGKMNLRGENRRMIQSNTEDYTNFFQSIKGYGIFWDNYSPTTIADDGTTLKLTSEVGDEIDYYFIYGGNADGVIAGVRQLTGEVPMLPLWTYGFHQSRERYKTGKELTDVVKGYRDARVPLDGIIQDWQYWGNNYLWNAMEFLNEDFPNPKEWVEEVHNMGAHMSISIWQSFGPQTKPYRELKEPRLP